CIRTDSAAGAWTRNSDHYRAAQGAPYPERWQPALSPAVAGVETVRPGTQGRQEDHLERRGTRAVLAWLGRRRSPVRGVGHDHDGTPPQRRRHGGLMQRVPRELEDGSVLRLPRDRGDP